VCSTPFGINERTTSALSPLWPDRRKCSTPFGINERTTRSSPTGRERPRCAQRLSASTKEPLSPSGSTLPKVEVLNAFRHQRKNHQRLGAKVSVQQDVLNAFRHQRKNHGKGCCWSGRVPEVLNAFRHQRKNHHTRQIDPEFLRPCSTPFGINERTTRTGIGSMTNTCGAQRLSASTKEPRDPRLRGGSGRGVLNAFRHQRKNHELIEFAMQLSEEVLNAFRHQRKNHAVQCERFRDRKRCSTPFGINERTTRGQLGRDTHFELCSTPFGINERTTGGMHERASPVRVLNAFRHQRKNHHSPGTIKFWSHCAQRLSASTKEPPFHQDTRWPAGKCSTPFGINERTTVRQWQVPLPLRSAQRLSASTKEPRCRAGFQSPHR